MKILRRGDVISASTEIRATPQQVYNIVSDVTRFGEWSPETYRAEWLDDHRFQAWNRRRFGRWRTTCHVTERSADHRFRFLVQALGGDWTEWTYECAPGSAAGTTWLTESFRMCVHLPVGAVIFELFFLFLTDRPADLRSNIEQCLSRIRAIAEAEAMRA